jgi:hypothetical protein
MTIDQVMAQVEMFRKGFPPLELARPCTVGDGIVVLDREQTAELIGIYEGAAAAGRSMKFVPASGAASRMFRMLAAINNRLGPNDEDQPKALSTCEDPDHEEFLRFVENVEGFAFYDDLKAALGRDGYNTDRLLAEGRYKPILEYLLNAKGLAYAELPKGLITFHRYGDQTRTAFEEQLVEAEAYLRDRDGVIRAHFTIAQASRKAFEEHIRMIRTHSQPTGADFSISLSAQEPSTDTIAVDAAKRPFRDRQGRLLFRPGGHGALLANLNRLQADIVFIKNIDNVTVDHRREPTIRFKKALGGYLVRLQERIFGYVRKLRGRNQDGALIEEVVEFMRKELSLNPPLHRPGGLEQDRIDDLISCLNRPLRVCGMVRNEGEPGGGPFWVQGPDGRLTPQIVESSQVDWDSRRQRSVWESSTHFNPVDLVCGLRDYRGKPFDLNAFVDPDTGFVSTKSQDGKELLALELPGLWNGAMAHWNTVFVEVPLATFSPVKTVLDLLREEHQSK